MGIHGGDIYRNKVTIDFSVNVNPLGVPDAVQKALHEAVAACSRYPDPEAEELRGAVAAMLHVPKEALVFGNGASELFVAILHHIRPKKILLPVPSFYGYQYAAQAAGAEIMFHEMPEERGFCAGEDLLEALTADVGLLFLANPNNPSGRLLDPKFLSRVLLHCEEKGIYVVLDECFIEFCEGARSMLAAAGQLEHLIIVRAFTKIFAIPGVRLGYLVCENSAVRRGIQEQLPEWNLSCFAQAAGIACAAQTGFLAQTRDYVRAERAFLEQGLMELGYRLFPSEANFILFYREGPLYAALQGQGLLIRDCSNFQGLAPGFYRIAVKSRRENEILLRAIGAWEACRR